MKSKSKFVTWFAAVVAAMAMAGCATTQEAEHSQHHPDTSTAQPAGMMPSGVPGDQMAMMDMKDMKAMCDMHKKMMSGKTPEEQKAMMDERMKSMSPEMMKKHMAMMQECK
jgi:fatty-acid desaturase